MAQCIRKAWLTLGDLSMALEEDGSHYCTELNLGYPSIRDNMNNKPDQSGVDDRTAYFAERVISANITAQGEQPIDAVAASFAPFMDVGARPTLHYVLDRGPVSPERTFTVRASGYAWPIVGSSKHRDIQLQWVAAEPTALDPTLHTATAWAGSTSGEGGRVYNLTFNRTYGAGGGSLPTSAILSSPGDVIVWPVLRIYGPISEPLVQFAYDDAPPAAIHFVPPFDIDTGHYVEIVTADKTAFREGDRAQPVLGSIDWLTTIWPYIPARGAEATMTLSGESTTGTTQVQASWQDRYLS